jgi:transcriptional regulator with XRE-family HTH domain
LSYFFPIFLVVPAEGKIMSASHFAGRLRELREQAGLSQKELADKANLTTDGISRLERGDRSPSWETAVTLAEALGVEVSAFLQEPAPRPQTGRGRPMKPLAEPAEVPPKRPRGRPRRGA